ncbi:MAG: hypothetical protein ACM3XS_04325 [Bacteroidota bacterium]
MTELLLKVLDTLGDFAEEAMEDPLGSRGSALPQAIKQFNTILDTVQADNPEDPVWRLVTSLDPEAHGFADLSLACRMLRQIGGASERRGRGGSVRRAGRPLWHLCKDTVLRSCYEGSVKVEPGCTLHLLGVVEGDVILLGDACLDLRGVVQGDVFTDPESNIEYFGVIEGSVRQSPRKEAGAASPDEVKVDFSGLRPQSEEK